MWLQQDGAAAHFARVVSEIYNERWLGRGVPVNWPSHLPDMTSPNFYLGFVKNIISKERSTTTESEHDKWCQ